MTSYLLSTIFLIYFQMVFMFQLLHPLIVAPGHGCDLLMEGLWLEQSVYYFWNTNHALTMCSTGQESDFCLQWTDQGLLRAILVSDT